MFWFIGSALKLLSGFKHDHRDIFESRTGAPSLVWVPLAPRNVCKMHLKGRSGLELSGWRNHAANKCTFQTATESTVTRQLSVPILVHIQIFCSGPPWQLQMWLAKLLTQTENTLLKHALLKSSPKCVCVVPNYTIVQRSSRLCGRSDYKVGFSLVPRGHQRLQTLPCLNC